MKTLIVLFSIVSVCFGNPEFQRVQEHATEDAEIFTFENINGYKFRVTLNSVGLNYDVKIPNDPNPGNDVIFLTSDEVTLEGCDAKLFYKMWLNDTQANSLMIGDVYEVQKLDTMTFNHSIDDKALKLSHYYIDDDIELTMTMELLDDNTLAYQEVYINDYAFIKTEQIFRFEENIDFEIPKASMKNFDFDMRQYFFNSAFILDTFYDGKGHSLKQFNRLFTDDEIELETNKITDESKLLIKEVDIIKKFN